jgi:NADH-quinone oxidoreductase subunit H
MFILEVILKFLIVVVPILLSVAYLTLAERKIMGSMQQRKGPNVVGFIGLLQPLADGLKLLLKETVIPTNSNTFNFVFSPILSLLLSLLGWSIISFSGSGFYIQVDLSVLLFFAVSSLGVYAIILSGWSSNSRYALFGCLRSAAQMISYEVSIGLILVCILFCVAGLNFIDIIDFQFFIFFVFPMFPLFILFLISILAETNRAPFDLPEAESELVSGYNVEYASMGFALFFLAEYSSMILMSAFTVILFLGGFIGFNFLSIVLEPMVFGLKLSAILFFYIWVRASFPRYRIDQLMRLCWKIFLPLALAFVLFVNSLLFCLNGML